MVYDGVMSIARMWNPMGQRLVLVCGTVHFGCYATIHCLLRLLIYYGKIRTTLAILRYSVYCDY